MKGGRTAAHDHRQLPANGRSRAAASRWASAWRTSACSRGCCARSKPLFTTQRDVAQARYNVLLGNLRLRQAVGQLAPADLDIVNRLLAR